MPCTRTMITCHPWAHMGSISYTWEFVTSWALAQQYYNEVKDGRDIRKGSFPPLRPINILTVLYFCLLFILYYWYFDSFLYFYISALSFLYFLDERRSRKVMQLMWTCAQTKFRQRKSIMVWFHAPATFLSCREGGGQTSGLGVGHKGLGTFWVLTNMARKLFSSEKKHHYLWYLFIICSIWS